MIPFFTAPSSNPGLSKAENSAFSEMQRVTVRALSANSTRSNIGRFPFPAQRLDSPRNDRLNALRGICRVQMKVGVQLLEQTLLDALLLCVDVGEEALLLGAW